VSRAFVKEDDQAGAEPLPDRPIGPHRNLVTPRGLRRRRLSANHCEAKGRPCVRRMSRHRPAANRTEASAKHSECEEEPSTFQAESIRELSAEALDASAGRHRTQGVDTTSVSGSFLAPWFGTPLLEENMAVGEQGGAQKHSERAEGHQATEHTEKHQTKRQSAAAADQRRPQHVIDAAHDKETPSRLRTYPNRWRRCTGARRLPGARPGAAPRAQRAGRRSGNPGRTRPARRRSTRLFRADSVGRERPPGSPRRSGMVRAQPWRTGTALSLYRARTSSRRAGGSQRD
jgi:hypothetical protein